MAVSDWFLLLHPAIAILLVFPSLGIVLYKAWQTRIRRLSLKHGQKSAIAPSAGNEHVQLGRFLSKSVVFVSLLGLAHPICAKALMQPGGTNVPLRLLEIAVMVILTGGAVILLERATKRLWKGIFAVVAGLGLIFLGLQPEIYRQDAEWYVSHYYLGMLATMLMLFSLAIVQDIYRDRSQRWRTVHVVVNIVATVLFIGQGITGSRALLEIPLSWQNSYVEGLYEKSCQTMPCTIEVHPANLKP